MKQDQELAYSVYINNYLIAEESVPDVIEYIDDGVCPLCKTDYTEITVSEDGKDASVPKSPTAGDTATFICPECEIEVTVEAWWVK